MPLRPRWPSKFHSADGDQTEASNNGGSGGRCALRVLLGAELSRPADTGGPSQANAASCAGVAAIFAEEMKHSGARTISRASHAPYIDVGGSTAVQLLGSPFCPGVNFR